jgi:hypothetical protein
MHQPGWVLAWARTWRSTRRLVNQSRTPVLFTSTRSLTYNLIISEASAQQDCEGTAIVASDAHACHTQRASSSCCHNRTATTEMKRRAWAVLKDGEINTKIHTRSRNSQGGTTLTVVRVRRVPQSLHLKQVLWYMLPSQERLSAG